MHPNEKVVQTLEIILIKVLRSYPHHGFWAMASGAKSMTNRRSKRNLRVFQKAKVSAGSLSSSLSDIDAICAAIGCVQRSSRPRFPEHRQTHRRRAQDGSRTDPPLRLSHQR